MSLDSAKVRITPNQLLTDLGIGYIEKSNRLALCCPFHNDSDPSAGFYTDTDLYHCFACQFTFGILDFYAKYKELTRAQAEQELIRTYGGTPPKREVDWFKSSTERIKAEAKLKERKGSDFQLHAALGEALDFTMWAYDRGHLSNDQLDLALKFWYGLLDGYLPRDVQQSGVAGNDLDGGVEEGFGSVPRIGSEGTKRTLDSIRTKVSDRLCEITGKRLPPEKVSGDGVDKQLSPALRSKFGDDEAGAVNLD